jgi:hypothetical protein
MYKPRFILQRKAQFLAGAESVYLGMRDEITGRQDAHSGIVFLAKERAIISGIQGAERVCPQAKRKHGD